MSKEQIQAYYESQGWDGICKTCGHDYINDCRGNCTCLSCNAQRQQEIELDLPFADED